jgi:hypothetical protein
LGVPAAEKPGIGQTAEAVEDYEKAIRLGLDEAVIHSNLALSRLDLGHNQQALDAAVLLCNAIRALQPYRCACSARTPR